jgi:hypothetical protein
LKKPSPLRHYAAMVSLTDSQLAAVMDAVRPLPVEKRDVYLRRIAAMLTMRGRGHFSDSDVSDVAKLALVRLGAAAGGVASGAGQFGLAAGPLSGAASVVARTPVRASEAAAGAKFRAAAWAGV